MMSIGIYKIISPSKKIYIGQSLHIERRFSYYKNLNNIKRQTKIYNSIKKYGWENHKFEIIEECILEQLNEREIYWIKFYNSVKKGLNITEGGNTLGRINLGIKRSQKIKDKISKTKILNPRKTTINMIENFRNISSLKKKVYQYDLQGNFIKEWPSINEAARCLNIKNDNISLCIRKKQKTGSGFQWFDTKQDHVNSVIRFQKNKTWNGNRNLEIDKYIDDIKIKYKNGMNISQIARIYNVHRDVIKLRLN